MPAMSCRPKRLLRRHPIMSGIAGLFIFGGFVLAMSDANTPVSQTNTGNPTPTATEVQQDTTPIAEPTSTATLGERNALNSAKDYLDVKAFSYSGLVKQLEFEGYTNSEAVYGADNSGADWNEQAKLSAESYLDVKSFSREGLIAQLEFEGFTRQQAEYGAQAVGY